MALLRSILPKAMAQFIISLFVPPTKEKHKRTSQMLFEGKTCIKISAGHI
jgi:hypothetical protein